VFVAFSLVWLVLSYILIIGYTTLLIYGFNASAKAKEVRKELILLLRKFNNSDLATDHEILENAIANV